MTMSSDKAVHHRAELPQLASTDLSVCWLRTVWGILFFYSIVSILPFMISPYCLQKEFSTESIWKDTVKSREFSSEEIHASLSYQKALRIHRCL